MLLLMGGRKSLETGQDGLTQSRILSVVSGLAGEFFNYKVTGHVVGRIGDDSSEGEITAGACLIGVQDGGSR
jgi:hypothetical protein